MFKTWIPKDARKNNNQKRKILPNKALFDFSYDETPMPYFEIRPAELLNDKRYKNLNRQDQGDFLRLIMQLWLDKAKHARYPELIAKNLGMTIEEWNTLESKLLELKLLVVSPDGLHLVQKELRSQYLYNRTSNMNKQRLNIQENPANEEADEDSEETAP